MNTPRSRRPILRISSMSAWCASSRGSTSSRTHGCVARVDSGVCSSDSMKRAIACGCSAAWIHAASCMAGCSYNTAASGLGNEAVSMISAQWISSAWADTSKPNFEPAMLARYPVQLGALASWEVLQAVMRVGVVVVAVAGQLERGAMMVEVPRQPRPLRVAEVEDGELVRAGEVGIIEGIALTMVLGDVDQLSVRTRVAAA